MRRTIIGFSLLLLVLATAFYFGYKTKKGSEQIVNNVSFTQKDSLPSAYRIDSVATVEVLQYEAWLKELPLKKNIQCYRAMLKNLYEVLDRGDCSTVNGENRAELTSKKAFQDFITQFSVLPFEDKYILTTRISARYSKSSYIVALFNKSDSLEVFSFEPCPESSSDSLYLKDWNNDGSIELFVESSTFKSNSRRDFSERSITVFDVSSFKNQIVELLSFPISIHNHSNDDNVSREEKTQFSFDSPNLLKLTTLSTTKAGKINENDSLVDFNGTTFGELKRAQKESMLNASEDKTTIKYYRQNKKTKQYIEVKK